MGQPGPQILLIDDDSAAAARTARAFANHPTGCHVTTVGTLAEARVVLTHAAPRLVITEWVLPDGSGLELLAAHRAGPPVIVLTDRGDERAAVAAMKAGALDYLVKSAATIAALPDLVCQAWTDRPPAEEALRDSEARFQVLVANAPEAVVVFELERGRFVDVNANAERLFGLDAAALLTQGPIELSPEHQPDGRRSDEAARAYTAQAVAGERPVFEWTHLTAAGQPVLCEVRLARLPDRRRTLVRGSITDITERKRVEESLRQSEERYRQLVEALTEFVVRWRPDGTRTFVNEAYCRFFGTTPAECVGTSFFPLIPEAQRDQVLQKIAALTPEQPVGVDEHQAIRPDGSLGWTEWTERGVFDAAGRLVEVQSVGRDTTDRKHAEESLRQREHLLRVFVENAPAAVAMFDRAMRYVMVSRRWQADYRLSATDVIGRSHYDVFPEIRSMPQWLEIHRRCLAGEVERRDADSFTRADGSTEWLRWEIHPWYEAANEVGGIIMFTEVITERVRAAEALRRLNTELDARVQLRTSELEAANRELEAFSYSVSHDLRTPLRAIGGYARLLGDEHGGELSEEARRLLEVIQKNTRHMGQLIDDLLSFSRFSRQPLALQRVDMDALVRAALDQLQDICASRRLDLRIAPLPPCLGDPRLLRQVFVNLLSNALKYSAGRAPAVICVESNVAPGEPGLIIYSVQDNGVGFDMRFADKLFGVFQRLHRPSDFEGTGVGLAIVQRIVHRHQGRVWAEAEVNKGAKFFVALPKVT